MSIAQIALDPPLSVKRANPNHPGKPLHPQATWEKVPQTILASLYSPPPPYGQCPYVNNTFQKGASLSNITFRTEQIRLKNAYVPFPSTHPRALSVVVRH